MRFLACWLLCLFGIGGFAFAHPQPQLFAVQKDAGGIEISPDGKLLAAVVPSSKNLRRFDTNFWDVTTRRKLWTRPDTPFRRFSPDGQLIIQRPLVPDGVDAPPVIEVRKARTGFLLHSLQGEDERAEEASADIGFSADSSLFLVATTKHLRCYDVKTGKLTRRIAWVQAGRATVLDSPNIALSGRVVVDLAQPTRFFNIQTGNFVRSVRLPHANQPGQQCLSPNATFFWTTANDENEFQAYHLSDGKRVWSYADPPQFTPDDTLAFVPTRRGLDVLDARTGRKLRTLPGPLSDNFAPSPDGNWLFEARDGVIWRWRAR